MQASETFVILLDIRKGIDYEEMKIYKIGRKSIRRTTERVNKFYLKNKNWRGRGRGRETW
jgi:hypothetical protein